MIDVSYLPKTTEGSVVFDLDDGETMHVRLRQDGSFYGCTESFDTIAITPEIMVKALNKYGAVLVGWEN